MITRVPPPNEEMLEASRASSRPPREKPPPRKIGDRAIRIVGIPFFGLLIPRVAGLFGDLTWREPSYWYGTIWFIAVSLAVWQGNRALLFWHGAHLDWFRHPISKLVALIAANVFYTTPVTVAMLAAWYLAAPLPHIDWPVIGNVTMIIVIAVLFITHAYETVFLINERRDDRLRVALTERARWQAELDTLKSELAPHFLFNCLNTLAVLIDEEPRAARKFNQHLASVCRYMLKQKDHDLVPLEDELKFFDDYVELARLRYMDSVQVIRRGLDDTRGLLLPPASLQLLLENAIKHNEFDAADPLVVEICRRDDVLVVTNATRARPSASVRAGASVGIGLRNLRERFILVAQREIAVANDDGVFRVKLPLVRRHG